MKRIIAFLILLIMAMSASGALTYDSANYLDQIAYSLANSTSQNPIYLNMAEVEGIIEAWTLEGNVTLSFPTNGASISNANNNAIEMTENTETFGWIFGTNKVEWTAGSTGVATVDCNDFSIEDVNSLTLATDGFIRLPAHDTEPGTTAGTVYYDLSLNQFLGRDNSSWVNLGQGAGTFTGGSITSDITLNDDVDIFSTTTTTDTSSIGVYDVDNTTYRDVLRWTNANTVAIALGNSLGTLAISSTGLNVTTAGVMTGVTDLTTTGTFTALGTQTVNISGSAATNIGTGTYTGAITIGNNSSSLAIGSSSWDMTSGGALSGLSTISLSDDITMADGQGLKPSTTTAESVGVYGYDTDGAYVGALVVTNSATPATVLGNTNGTTAISSSDWTISTAGNMGGIGTITNDGLITATGGLTLSGTVSINDSATSSTTSIGGGTTTGTITIGGTGTQAINIGNGAGVKTVALGSSNTTSTTTILGGSNGVKINVGSLDDPTYINTGVNTGAVHIGGTGVQTIAIGDDGTGAKTITIGDGASTGSTVIKAGTGNLDLSAVDDVSLNGGSAGSIIGIGQNTDGNVIRIGQDDTTADTITIGSAKDTTAVAGISLTLGSTGSTSATVIQSGSGEVKINEDNNQPVSIGTGTCTGTVTIGGAGTQTVTIGNGAAAKTVTIGSSNTTSTTNILAGSGNINITGSVVRTAQQHIQTIGYCKVGSTGGWVIPAASDAAHLATLPQSQTNSTLIIPITIPLKVGWTITAWTLNGQIDSGGNIATLDAKLYEHVEATGGFSNAAIGSGMSQLSKTADYKVVDGEASLTETVAVGDSYYLLITGTTAATTDIEIAGITVTVSEI